MIYSGDFLSVGRHDRTLVLTPLQQGLITINTIVLPHCHSLSSFRLEVAARAKWHEVHQQSTVTELPLQRDCLLQFPNRLLSAQYRLLFGEDVSELIYGTDFVAAYWPLPLWSDREILTPGLFLDVFLDCYTWISLGEAEPHTLSAQVLWVSSGLVFDWQNQCICGMIREKERTVLAASRRESDASLLLRHFRIRFCDGDRFKLTISSTDGRSLVGLRVQNQDDQWIVPDGFQLTTLTLCARKDSNVRLSADYAVDYRIEMNGFSYIITVPSQGITLPLYHRILNGSAASVIDFASPGESQAVPYSFSLSLDLQSIPFREWKGESLLMLSIRSGLPELVTVTAIRVDQLDLQALSLRCEEQCRFLLRVSTTISAITLTLTVNTGLSPSDILSSLRFAVWFAPTLQELVSSSLSVTSHHFDSSAVHSPSVVLDHSRNTFAVVPDLNSPAWLQFTVVPDMISCFSFLRVRFMVLPPRPLVIRVMDGVSKAILHNTVALPSLSSLWSTINITLTDVPPTASLRISFDPLQRYHQGPLELRVQQVEMSCAVTVPATHMEVEEVEEPVTPLLHRLEEIIQPKESALKEKTPFTSILYCPEMRDPIEDILWHRSPAVTHASARCGNGKRLWRFCDSKGQWRPAEGSCIEKTVDLSLLQAAIRRAGSSREESLPPPPSHCPSHSVNGMAFPASALNTTVTQPCVSPFYGSITRYCSPQGEWETVHDCQRCPKGAFPDRSENGTLCVPCPSGTAFLRGNPRSAIRCYGQFYSEGGVTECQLCLGETRGSRRTGNIACKPCEGGIVIGYTCVNTTFCDGNVKVGGVVYASCGSGKRGFVARMCRKGSGTTGVLGRVHREGCCRYSRVNERVVDEKPPLGSSLFWVQFFVNNIHVSALRHDAHSQVQNSQTVLVFIEALKEIMGSFFLRNVQFIHYRDLSTSVASSCFSDSRPASKRLYPSSSRHLLPNRQCFPSCKTSLRV